MQALFKKLIIIFYSLIYLFSIPIVANNVHSYYSHLISNSYNENKKYDAVILLSGFLSEYSQNKNEYFLNFGNSAERYVAAYQIMKKQQAKILIITGGSGSIYNQQKKEAALAMQLSVDLGLDKKSILIEPSSRNTFENAYNVRLLLEQKNIIDGNFLLITSNYHMLRAKKCFEEQNIKFDVLGVGNEKVIEQKLWYYLSPLHYLPTLNSLQSSKIILKEILGLIFYTFKGYI